MWGSGFDRASADAVRLKELPPPFGLFSGRGPAYSHILALEKAPSNRLGHGLGCAANILFSLARLRILMSRSQTMLTNLTGALPEAGSWRLLAAVVSALQTVDGVFARKLHFSQSPGGVRRILLCLVLRTSVTSDGVRRLAEAAEEGHLKAPYIDLVFTAEGTDAYMSI